MPGVTGQVFVSDCNNPFWDGRVKVSQVPEGGIAMNSSVGRLFIRSRPLGTYVGQLREVGVDFHTENRATFTSPLTLGMRNAPRQRFQTSGTVRFKACQIGRTFRIINRSSGTLTLESTDGTNVSVFAQVPAGETAEIQRMEGTVPGNPSGTVARWEVVGNTVANVFAPGQILARPTTAGAGAPYPVNVTDGLILDDTLRIDYANVNPQLIPFDDPGFTADNVADAIIEAASGGAAVTSVNGKTGAVVLVAGDIAANPPAFDPLATTIQAYVDALESAKANKVQSIAPTGGLTINGAQLAVQLGSILLLGIADNGIASTKLGGDVTAQGRSLLTAATPAAARDVISASSLTPLRTDYFATTNTSVAPPAGWKAVRIRAAGGGGGGGSGGIQTSSASTGGSAGAPGAAGEVWLTQADLPGATLRVNIGAGGAGAAGRLGSAGAGNGSNGTAGGDTSLQSSDGLTTYLLLSGGPRGGAGTAATVLGGGGHGFDGIPMPAGGSSNTTTAGAPSAPRGRRFSGGSGGGGGGLNGSGGFLQPGAGGAGNSSDSGGTVNVGGGGAAGTSGATPTNGANGADGTYGGAGGGGGGGGPATGPSNSGNGGNGGTAAGGGGSGALRGTATTGVNTGTAGNGGNGYLEATWFG